MTRIINFSGGACSYWAADREIREFGPKNCMLLFADTLIESADLYEFNKRAEDKLGVQLTRICVGITPWQLFRREGLIGNDRVPICSTKLKREPLNEWMENQFEMDSNQSNMFKVPGAVVLGFDWTELHRVSDFQAQHPTWTVSAPMTVAPYWDKCRIISECELIGFQKPILYQLGFPHNNCGGACVRAGITQFVHLYRVLPAVYAEWEREEQETMADFQGRGIQIFTVLKDRRGGTTKSLSLLELRLRIEAGEKFDEFDWGGCGCGGAA